MVKCPGAGFIAFNFGIGLSALIVATSLSLPGRTQSADLVLCDRIAADPSDPDKPADVKGTPEIAQSDIATAIKFCKNASASSRRAMYELGRAYAANRQMSEAVSAWRKAAEKGSTSAMVELGVMLGTGAGGPKDQAKARKLLERAARPATLVALPISLLFPQMVVLHQIQAGQERCWRKRPKRTQRKLSINLD
jgi:hypothetical protein